MAGTVSDGGQYWSYRQDGNIGIWEIHDWEQLFETEIGDAEVHYSKEADRDEIMASIVVFESAETLGSGMQEHLTEAWSQLAQSVDGIERTAYVADGITALAVKSNVNAPDTELDSFESLDEAVQWAGE